MAFCLSAGVVLVFRFADPADPYPWIAVGLGCLFALAVSIAVLLNAFRRQRQKAVTRLARSIRRATVNEQFSPDTLIPADDYFHELTEEIRRLLLSLDRIRQQGQQELDELRRLTAESAEALQREVNARRSAQEKLQSLARQLERSNRQLQDNLHQTQFADKAKAEFLSTMSHEIRTPLNAVLGVASLLDRSPLSERQRQQLGMIVESGKALLGILNDIMDYVRIEAGEIALDSFPFNIRDTLMTVFNRYGEEAHARGIEYRFHCEDSVPKLFVGDGARIQQLVNSLIDNAVKFTHDGAVNVSLSGSALQNFRYLLRIEVRDTGIGISADQRANLFQVFSQGDNSITRAYGGSGMGLAICSRLVKLMGGTLGVESEPGSGSLFWSELPLSLYHDLPLTEPV